MDENNSQVKYCSKCLNKLDDKYVVDIDGNKFCDRYCKRNYWLEIRQDRDDWLPDDWKKGFRVWRRGS